MADDQPTTPAPWCCQRCGWTPDECACPEGYQPPPVTPALQAASDKRKAAQQTTPLQWRPIADMPEAVRESESVLLYKPDEPRSGPEIVTAYWGQWPGVDGWTWIRVGGQPLAWVSMWTGEPVQHGIPTHWMRLPEPPHGR